jgi:hypothetical protein
MHIIKKCISSKFFYDISDFKGLIKAHLIDLAGFKLGIH